jgi:hypothetical protein
VQTTAFPPGWTRGTAIATVDIAALLALLAALISGVGDVIRQRSAALARGEATSMAADVDGQTAFPDGNDEELVERSMAASVEV